MSIARADGRRALEVPTSGLSRGDGGVPASRDVFTGYRYPMAWTRARARRPPVDRSRETSSRLGPTFSGLRQCLGEPLINGITGYPRDATNSALSIYADPSSFTCTVSNYWYILTDGPRYWSRTGFIRDGPARSGEIHRTRRIGVSSRTWSRIRRLRRCDWA